MKKRFWTLCLCCFSVLLAQSVFFGAVGDPGSESDPVITESYFNNAISSVNSSISQLNTTINGVGTRVGTLETKASSLETRASSVETRVSSTESKVVSLNARIAALESNSASAVSSADLRVVAAFAKLNLNKKYAATVAKVALKSQPSASSSTLATMPYYAGVSVIDAQSGWVKVKYYSYTGWVQYDKLTAKMLY